MKRLLSLAAALLFAGASFAQGEYHYQRRSLFEVLPVCSSDIVFLGNSITDGCEWSELFDSRHVKNRGISGDRTAWMLERLDPIIAGHPKKLFVMIGVNDLAGGSAPEQIVADLARLIDRFRTESKWTKIYHLVVTTNKRIEALCDEKGVTYLDVWGALADDEGRLDKRYTNDGLHLTGEGYLVWRDAIKAYVK